MARRTLTDEEKKAAMQRLFDEADAEGFRWVNAKIGDETNDDGEPVLVGAAGGTPVRIRVTPLLPPSK